VTDLEAGSALFSFGHGARPLEVFLDLLRGAGIRRLVDVRTAPGSKKHPHFGRDALGASLADAGIEYRWEPSLGGWRRPKPDSRHVALRSSGFRGYADHMETEEFAHAVDRLIAEGSEHRTAFMCSESLWWRCHRRLLSDALTVRGCRVLHLMEGGRLEPHTLSSMARLEGGSLVYDVAADSGITQQELLPREG
jgi:uncharacterized protein (DUF488 family)